MIWRMGQWVCDNEGWHEAPSRRRLAGQLALVLAVCLALRVWLVVKGDLISRDGTIYVALAEEWDRGGSAELARAYPQHLGYPLTMVGVHRALTPLGLPPGRDGWELVGRSISLTASLGAMAALWLLAGMTFNWRVAFLAAIVFGVGEKWAGDGADVLTDPLAVCLQMWALAMALLAARKLATSRLHSAALAAGAGLLAGLGYLVRPEAMLMVPAAAGLWIIERFRLRRPWGRTLLCVLLAVVCAAACALPYMLLIGGFTRRIIFQPAIVASPAILAAAGVENYVAPIQLANKMFEAMNPVLAVLACLYLAGYIGMQWLILRLPNAVQHAYLPPRRDGGVLTLLVAGLLLPVLIVHYIQLGSLSYRYLLTLAMLLAPMAVVGGLMLAEWLLWVPKRLWWRVTSNWLVYPGAAAVVIGMLTQSLQPKHAEQAGFRQAGVLVAGKVGRTAQLVSDSSWVLYYAGGDAKALRGRVRRVEDRQSLIDILRSDATCLALTDRALHNLPREARDLLRPPLFLEVAVFPQTAKTPSGEIHLYRTIMPLFQEQDYLHLNSDVREGIRQGHFPSAWGHYLAGGWREGRRTCLFFDETYYLKNNPSAAKAVADGRYASGLEHYIAEGADQDLPCSENFDARCYLASRPDVRQAVAAGVFRCALEHFLLFGRGEIPRPVLPEFDEAFYLDEYPDVRQAVAAGEYRRGLDHYVLCGRAEGRRGRP